MANPLPKTLAFRHTFVSSVVKENTVTLFGEIGAEFQLGTDYDAEILYKVSSSELSNLFNYYNGGLLNSQVVLPNGSVGSADLTSMLSVNAEVTEVSIKPYHYGYMEGERSRLTPQDSKQDGGQYYLGDVVLFNPDPLGDVSCWTCIRTTSSPAAPIPLRGTVTPGQINRDAVPGSTYQFAGFYGTDRNSQNYITGVKPAYYTVPGATSTNVTLPNPLATLVYNSEYWKESAIARSYNSAAIYYAGELVTFSGGVYECISTQGDKVTPSLFRNVTPGTAAETIKLSTSLDARNGAFGADFGGQRYIQNVPPVGGTHSEQYWKPGSFRRLPTTVYANLNWTNFEVNGKINQYDANITGGNGAQTIPSFTDDVGSKVVTLRKIYDDNEKGFIMDVATSILSRIPAAAIKAQVIGQRPAPDSSLAEMVLAGPHWTYPDNYAPAVQGVFEEAVYRDMLQVSGVPTTITDFIVSTGSEGYFQDGSTGRPAVDLIQKIGGKSILATNPLNCTYNINNRVYARCGISRVFVDKSKPSYITDTNAYATGDVVTFTFPNQESMFFIQPTAVVNAVDETNGKILSVTVTNPGDGILGLGAVSCNGKVLSYLIPYAKVSSLASAFLPIDTKVDHWDFTGGQLVTITQGSGSGATGMAVVTAAAHNPPLTTEYSGTLSVSFDKNSYAGVEYGSNYLGPPNNLYKQDLVMITQSGTSARIPAVVTEVDTNGGIRNVKLLKQGCGYLQAPIIQLGRPPLNPLDTARACDPVSGATGGVIIDDVQLLGVTLSGRYTLKTSSGDTVLPLGYVSGIGSTYGQINPYVGINYVDVVYGGLGFKSGELLDVIGSVTPAVFTNFINNSAGGTFLTNLVGGTITSQNAITIVNGGNGYKQDQYVVLDGPTAGVELLGQVTRLGGDVKSLFFQDSDLCGISYSVGNSFNFYNNANEDDGSFGDLLVGLVTKVGASGQLYDKDQITKGPTSLAYSNVGSTTKAIIGDSGLTGTTYNVRDLLTGIPLYNQVESITITKSGAIYSGTSNPTITIGNATATGNGLSGFVATNATAVAVLGLNGLGVTGAKGAKFVSGDFIYVNQVEGVNTGVAAVPGKAVVLQVDDVGAIQALGVENTGEDFDLSKPFFYTTTGDGTAPGGSTGGTTFDAMFQSYFTIIRVEMLNRGKGYLSKPTVTISGTSRGVPQLCDAIIQRAGSGGLFQLTSFDPTSTPIGFTVKLLNRGVGYVEGDVLEFWGPLLADDGYVQGHGVLALVDRTVGGNILAVDFSNVGPVRGSLYKPGPYIHYMLGGLPNNPFGNEFFPFRFRVLTVGDPTSISAINILKGRGVFNVGDLFSHKRIATVSVDQVDSFGKILSLKYDNPGYGYRGIPVVKPRKDSAGIAALFSVPYMGVSRIENGYYANGFDISSVKISSPVSLLPATAYATIPGDLHPISVDLFKNPNILDTLETIKPGSTTGYAQGKAIMSIQNVFVKHPGKSLGNLLSTSHGQTGAQDLQINISPPDLTPEQGGIQATAFVQSSGWDQTFQRILAVTIPPDGRGAGYLKPPIITVTLADGNISDNMPILVAQMAVTGVRVTSRGLGFGNPPGALIEDSDLTPGLHATVTSTTLKKTITQFDVTNPGAQYIEVPSVRVISEGTDQKGYIRTAITDIQVSSPGAGFKVGDVLEFGHFGTTGLTLTYAGATGVTYLFNAPPPSDKVYLKGDYGGVTFQSTECAQACVSEVDEIGGIVSVKINYRPYDPSKDKYGIDSRVLSKNSILYGGLGYGYPSYYEPNSGQTYMMETLPRVIGFYRPDRYAADDYFDPGVTLANSSTVPWIDPTDGTIIKGATFISPLVGIEAPILTKLSLDTSGTTLLSDLYTANAIRLPTIETRLGIRKFDVWNGKEGKNHVNDAQILVETPPQSQQARYSAIRDPATNTVTTYARQSGGLGYTSVPRILITGGGGDGANATPNMGIGEVKILNGGSGYKVGDVVNFPLPSGGGGAASGIVTVVDGGVLSTGKFAELDFANCDIASTIYTKATSTVSGGGATGTPVLFSKGYGYTVGEEVSALPTTLISSQDPSIIFNGDSTSWTVPMFPSKMDGPNEVVDVEHGYMYTWGEITSRSMFKMPLGYVFGVRPSTARKGNDAYAILMVNAIMTTRDELIILYDQDGNLVSAASPLGAYSYENYPGFGERTGLVTATNPLLPFASMGVYANPRDIAGVGLGEIPSFRFMGWSDGVDEPATRYGYRDWWWVISQIYPEFIDVTRSPATFRVDSIDDQANGYAAGTLLTSGSLGYFDASYTLMTTPRGEITYVDIVHKGSGYTAVPETSAITVNSLDGTSTGTGARFYATLTMVSLLATTVGNLYFSAPQVYIDPPMFRSLSPQLYARSAEILYQNLSNFDWISINDPAIEVISNGEGYVWSGIYKLVVDTTVGGMHQTGNASFSIDSLIMFGGTQNLNDENDLTSGVKDKTTRYKIKDSGLFTPPSPAPPATKSLLQESTYIVRGSNYRPNEIYKLIPYGSTPSLTTSIKKGVAAVIKILKVTDYLNNDGTQIFGSGNNDFIGILDEGRVINDEDVGGYGTGYLEIPQINIVGGPQGIEMAPSLGLTNVDYLDGNRGTNYTVGDEVWAEAPEFGAVVVGKVSKVFSDTVGGVTTDGIIGGVNLYTPYKEGLRSLPKLSVVRKGQFVAASVDAQLLASLGISKAAITSNTDGFVGDAFVRVDFPNGSGYVVQPKQGAIEPKYVFMVDQVTVNSSGNSSSPILYEKAPVVKFDIPPFINTYSGWNGVYFAPGDAFEIVIQYTIAKAVAFEVDPDVTLPSKYIEADSITIGGVTIPLRKPGSATSQGREISQNRVIYRYLVKFQAV